MAVENYDPHVFEGIHIVRITIQQWGYVGHITEKVHGNCKGREVLDFDFECGDGNLENDCDLQYDEESRCFTATLRNESGGAITVAGSPYCFNRMIVTVEIMDYVDG